MQPGLYEQLLTLALQQDLEQLADPRLYAVAPVDAEDAHAALAQFWNTCRPMRWQLFAVRKLESGSGGWSSGSGLH